MTGTFPEPRGNAVGDVTNVAISDRIGQLVQATNIENVNYTIYGANGGSAAKVKTTTLLSGELIRASLEAYVRPPNREVAALRLRENHAVLLYGPRGTGRTTIALDILPAITGRAEIHRVVFDPEAEDEFDVTRLPREPGTSYLFDVSDPGGVSGDRIAQLVAGYAAELRGNGAHLVVVAREDLSHSVRTDVPAVRVEQPRATAVFSAHLSAAGLQRDLITRLLEHPKITGLPLPTRPSDVARLAAQLVPVGEADDDHFTDAVDNAVGAFTDWKESLLVWFDSNKELEKRAFMFTTAVLHPAPGGTVSGAARGLASHLDPQNTEAAPLPLQGPPLGRRAEEITAELGADGAIRFVPPQYAPAVRHFVWRHYAEYRPELTKWLTSVPGNDPSRVVGTVIDLVTATSDETLLGKAADSWSATRRDAAVLLLSTLATDPGIGQRVRALLYDWAYNGKHEHRMLTVAAVCARYGTAYEQNALTRLRQLARHPQETILVETIKALCELAAGDQGRRRRIVEEVTGRWITDPKATRARSGRYAFAALARLESRDGTPVLLEDLASVQEPRPSPIADGVRALLRDDPREAGVVVDVWVNAALEAASLYEPLLRTLIQAAAGDSIATSRLSFIANRWSDGPAELHAFQHTLITMIERSDPLIDNNGDAGVQEGDDAA